MLKMIKKYHQVNSNAVSYVLFKLISREIKCVNECHNNEIKLIPLLKISNLAKIVSRTLRGKGRKNL